ncbi:MAG: LON peptidase substrate-binding domain-containing protein [Gammaproteobacteria bacterium]|nr:LON peptidase substrate-binding domain-containing protein [Gammaproteobacteria bacterium]
MPTSPQIAGTDAAATLPLFPLGTVLFPGGLLPLQIFETRYVDMVRRCMREGSPFGVVLILEGREARQEVREGPPAIAPIGTRARIVDFTELPNGLLGITARGEGRFRVLSTEEQADHLLIGQVVDVPDMPEAEMPAESFALVEILKQLLEHPAVNQLGLEADLDDVGSVVGRLADLLPVDPRFKQGLLEQQDPMVCLAELERLIQAMQERAS